MLMLCLLAVASAIYSGEAYQSCKWTEFLLTNIYGGEAVEVSSLADCQAACLQRQGCESVDFNPSDNGCWLLTTQEGKQPNSDVDHYDVHCEEIDPCTPNPCQNGGTCTEVGESYTCSCAAGYEGTNCENEIDPCSPNPCQNGGTCTGSGLVYDCACPPGYEGTHCETEIDPCSPNPCQNGGFCSASGLDYQCTCAPGFEGTHCETEIDPCTPNPCQNGGHCSAAGLFYICTCECGFTGTHCETSETPEGCTWKHFPEQNIYGGEAVTVTSLCECQAECSKRRSCESLDFNPSDNGCWLLTTKEGKQPNADIQHYDLNCQEECEPPVEPPVDPCSPNPCQNGGTCSASGESYTCTCAAGYEGTNCETEIDPCSPNPCQNGGTCSASGESYTCTCAAGYEGTNCETEIDPCSPNPCQNEGTCTASGLDHECTCTCGFTGTNCETSITPPSCAWTLYPEENIWGGAAVEVTSLCECQVACVNSPGCISLDFNPSNNGCWLLTTKEGRQTNLEIEHYDLDC